MVIAKFSLTAAMMVAFVGLHQGPASAFEISKCASVIFKADEYQACVDREEAPMIGKYLCVVDYIAGLQNIKNGGRQPFSRISQQDSRFFMEISRYDALPCNSIGSQFYLLKESGCKTRYQLTAKSELVPSPSYSLTMPQDFHGPRGDFSIARDGQFWGNYRFDSHHVVEGKCEKIT